MYPCVKADGKTIPIPYAIIIRVVIVSSTTQYPNLLLDRLSMMDNEEIANDNTFDIAKNTLMVLKLISFSLTMIE